MKFITKNSSHSTLLIGYKEKYIEETVNTKYLGLHTDNHINWKKHIGERIPKLSEACRAVMSTVHISDITTLKPTDYENFLYNGIYRIILVGGYLCQEWEDFHFTKNKSP